MVNSCALLRLLPRRRHSPASFTRHCRQKSSLEFQQTWEEGLWSFAWFASHVLTDLYRAARRAYCNPQSGRGIIAQVDMQLGLEKFPGTNHSHFTGDTLRHHLALTGHDIRTADPPNDVLEKSGIRFRLPLNSIRTISKWESFPLGNTVGAVCVIGAAKG